MIDIVSNAGPQMARYLTYSAARVSAEAALGCGFLSGSFNRLASDARQRDRPSDR
jgi:hypothetical protein